jgi:hypothetical protein
MLPVITQEVEERNRIFATPRVTKVTLLTGVSFPELYAVDMVHVIVTSLAVLLKINTASPAAKTEFGIVIDPPEPTPTTLPISLVVS